MKRNGNANRWLVGFVALLAVGSLVACGGSDPLGNPGSLDTTDQAWTTEEDFDGVTPVRVRVDGLGLAVEPLVRLDSAVDDSPRWDLTIEANRPLAAVRAFDAAGQPGEVVLHDEYRFELRLESAALAGLLAGEPMFLRLQAAGGARLNYSARVLLRARLADPRGALSLWLEPSLRPVAVGAEIFFRAALVCSANIAELVGITDVDADPESAQLPDDRWRLEWSRPALMTLLQSPGAPLHLVGTDAAGARYQAQTAIQVVLDGIGLSTGEPDNVWPSPGCDSAVAACLARLARASADTEVCGPAIQVLACR